MLFIYGAIVGVLAGGTLSFLYANKVIAKAKAEAAAVGASVAASVNQAAKKL
jgi:hypothetical protein